MRVLLRPAYAFEEFRSRPSAKRS